MRTYGTIGDVYFVKQGFSIYTLGYEYKLINLGDNTESQIVSVCNMKELKSKITDYANQGGR